jgi:hypothetical protein
MKCGLTMGWRENCYCLMKMAAEMIRKRRRWEKQRRRLEQLEREGVAQTAGEEMRRGRKTNRPGQDGQSKLF